ncbi:uncharacterized protein LOC133036276 [Cannabis sativa]|uniref:uncharacterized protein LOC133036276 n=1 Tax=Cannabis sativa TaxID=3483 RepID=UPI0029CA6C12|nr:uncharacterized protein LOC133036276 [Cannabis sativa]
MVYQKKPTFIFLCETLSLKPQLELLSSQLGYEGMFSVDAQGRGRGLAMLWKEQTDVEVRGFSQNHIDLIVHRNNLFDWRLTGVNGEPNWALRRNTWNLMRILKEESALPWCIIGDLNNVLSQVDKRGGNPYPNWLLEGFQQAVADCDLVNLELVGHQFTWEKGRDSENLIEVRLDRALANSDWEQWGGCVSNNIVDKIVVVQEPLKSWGNDLTGNFKERIQSCKRRIGALKNFSDSASFWLKEGDRNTKYFHAAASSRRKNNFIHQLKNEAGDWVKWETGLPQVMVNYFTDIFHSLGTHGNDILDKIQPLIRDDDNVTLLQPVLEEEVHSAVFPMHPDKSPGPDGMTPAFYQKCWHIVGQDVVRLLQNFFRNKVMPKDLNATNLVLIQKKKMPVISEFQSAFIPGRLITDNVLVSFEILHYLRRKQQGKQGCMALKLDMSKAYDRMEWSFLHAILLRMGFSVDWVMMIMECLSALIQLYEEKKWIHGCRVARRAPYVTHMFFADDSFMYCSATMEEAQCVLELLKRFEEASGQKVNLNKSSVFFSSNTIDSVRFGILSTLHMHAADENSFYLGLPSVVGRNKNVAFGFLKEKIRKRIQNWDSKLLSRAGKETLIASWEDSGGILRPLKVEESIGKAGISCGANPSYAWRSIIEAQDVVKLGARWCVGSGSSISVLNQPWLPSMDNPYVISSHEALQDCHVSNLLQTNQMCWDVELSDDLFEPGDVDLICKIPLPTLPKLDTWYWSFETFGGYPVRSAYRALQRKFWYLKLPPKVKNLLWRALTNCLPTLVSLQTKRVHVYSICSLCNVAPETTFHIMADCSFTKACLERGLGLHINNGDEDFGGWFEDFCNTHLAEKIDKLAMILWSVWGRNDLLWNNKATSVEKVISSAITYLELWKFAQNKNGGVSSSSSQPRAGVEHWIKPSLGELKLRGEIDLVVAEALSMKEALSWVKSCWEEGSASEDFRPTAVIMESDCLLLFSLLNDLGTKRLTEGTSIVRPPLLNDSNYPYWKVRMRAFIKSQNEKAWRMVLSGWSPPVVVDSEDDKLFAYNSKDLHAIFNGVGEGYIKLISSCESAKDA